MIVNTVVATDPAHAFAVFTDGIGGWWKRTPRHMWRYDTDAIIRFEDRRLLEVHDDETFLMGEVSIWEPGQRLVFSWLVPHPAGTAPPTEVEVRFEDLGGRTRVVLEHRGVPGIKIGDTRSSVIGLWWSDLLVAFGVTLG